MKLAALDLQNFRCHRKTTIEFGPRVTLIYGRNGTGKSSIADALEFALAGRCRGTDAGGKGAQVLVGPWGGMATIRLTIDTGEFFERTIPANGSRPALISREVASILVDGTRIIDLQHADAKALLLGILDAHVEIDGERLSLGELDSCEQQAREARAAAKKLRDSIIVPAKPDGELYDIAGIERKLADLRDNEKALIAQQAQGAGNRRALERQGEAVRVEIANLQAKLATYGETLDEDLEAAERRVEKQRKGRPDDAQRNRLTVASATERLSMLRHTLAKLSDHHPDRGCVLDNRVPCKTAKKAFADYIAELGKQIAAIEKEKADALAAIDAEVKQDAAAQAALQVLEQTRRAVADRARDGEAIEQAQRRLADVQRQLAKCPADDGTGSEELATLRTRIQKGEEILRAAREAQRQADGHEAEQKRLDEAKAEVERLEARCALLGPKGARVAALDAALERFTPGINDGLAPFDIGVEFQMEPWKILVNGRPAEMLSASERLRFGLAFQMALAQAVGAGFIVVDQADILDRGNRRILTNLAMGWGGGQVIVLATRDDGEDLPAIDGVPAYRLTRSGRDAGTKVVRAEEAAEP